MKLLAVTDNKSSVAELSSIISKVKDEIDCVHIRERNKSAAELIRLLQQLEANGVENEKIVINDRLDLALLMNIPTVHLPGHSFPIKLVKQRYPQLRVGTSVHSLQEAIQAEQDGADYVLYGHCFFTNSKKGITPNGTKPILELKRVLKIPVYAIGGITPERVSMLKVVKTDGIAVMSGIFAEKDPLGAAQEFNNRLKEG